MKSVFVLGILFICAAVSVSWSRNDDAQARQSFTEKTRQQYAQSQTKMFHLGGHDNDANTSHICIGHFHDHHHEH